MHAHTQMHRHYTVDGKKEKIKTNIVAAMTLPTISYATYHIFCDDTTYHIFCDDATYHIFFTGLRRDSFASRLRCALRHRRRTAALHLSVHVGILAHGLVVDRATGALLRRH